MATLSPAWAQTLELSSLLQEGGYSERALKQHFLRILEFWFKKKYSEIL